MWTHVDGRQIAADFAEQHVRVQRQNRSAAAYDHTVDWNEDSARSLLGPGARMYSPRISSSSTASPGCSSDSIKGSTTDFFICIL